MHCKKIPKGTKIFFFAGESQNSKKEEKVKVGYYKDKNNIILSS